MNIKRNFAYSSILTASNYIFPLLTFPYISRVLGVQNVGVCNFADSIINYCIIVSMMGIGTLGIRVSAKYRNNKDMLNASFTALFLINSLTTLIMLIALVIATFTVPELYAHKDLMFMGGFKILFTLFMFEWYFKGVEDFKFITSRGVAVKLAYVALVFILVRDKNDYPIYYGLSVLMIVVNALIGSWYLKDKIKPMINRIVIKAYIRPFLILGGYTLLTSMYTSFNVAFLGFTSGSKEVGYYTTAIKLYSICLSLFSAFTGVMLPRISVLLGEKKIDEVKRLIGKSYDVLFAFSIPIIVFTTFFASDIINVLAGPGYEGAILPMKIIMPLMLIIGIEQVLVIQLLMPLKKDNAILTNSILGAVIGILMNIVLVPFYKSIGSSFVLVISELSVLIASQLFVKKFLNIEFPFSKLLKQIFSLAPIYIICYLSNLFVSAHVLKLVISFGLSLCYFLAIQFYVVKNELVVSYLGQLRFSRIRG